jgi:glycosyltransferase involved in cell wall biosynthesis
MKILIQNSLYYPRVIGGAEISSHLLGQELRRRGIEADAVASTGKHGRGNQLNRRPTADGLGTVYEADAHGLCDLWSENGPEPRAGFLVRGANHLGMVHSARWNRLFDQVLDLARPDIVHTNTIVGLTPAIWGAAARRNIPVVHTLRDYHLLCPRTTLLRSSGADCINPPLPCRVLAGLKMRQTHSVTLVTAPTSFVLGKHLDHGGFSGARSAVVPNALEEWPPEIPDRLSEGPVRGLFLGQINAHKGISLLLEVLAELFRNPAFARLEFDFAGTGPLSRSVEEFCAAHRDRARCHGQVTGDAKRTLLREASFMTVPSVWAEPFSRSIIDGFSWGLPAIGFRVGGIPEVITHQSDGLLVPPVATELRQAMVRLLQDDDLRLGLGRNARTRAADFTLERQVDSFQKLYEDILGEGSGRDSQG